MNQFQQQLYYILTEEETYDIDEGKVGDALKKIGAKAKKTAAVGALCVAGACAKADAPTTHDTSPQSGATTHQTERPMSPRRARAQKNIDMLKRIGQAARSGASQETLNKMAGRGEAKHTDPIKAELDKNKGSEGGEGYQPPAKGGKAKVKDKDKAKTTTTPKHKQSKKPGSGVSAEEDDI